MNTPDWTSNISGRKRQEEQEALQVFKGTLEGGNKLACIYELNGAGNLNIPFSQLSVVYKTANARNMKTGDDTTVL